MTEEFQFVCGYLSEGTPVLRLWGFLLVIAVLEGFGRLYLERVGHVLALVFIRGVEVFGLLNAFALAKACLEFDALLEFLVIVLQLRLLEDALDLHVVEVSS
jgi:hypothetical protein